MVNVRIVRVSVHQRLVLMMVPMRNWVCDRRIVWAVRVLVMRVVNVGVIVRHAFVDVLVNMLFRHMKPDAQGHQHSRAEECWRNRVAPQRQ